MTLIAKYATYLMQKGLKRRITLMYYVDFYSLFNNPEKEWKIILTKTSEAPPQPSLFDRGGLYNKKMTRTP